MTELILVYASGAKDAVSTIIYSTNISILVGNRISNTCTLSVSIWSNGSNIWSLSISDISGHDLRHILAIKSLEDQSLCPGCCSPGCP